VPAADRRRGLYDDTGPGVGRNSPACPAHHAFPRKQKGDDRPSLTRALLADDDRR
jgi:hypothetical protein